MRRQLRSPYLLGDHVAAAAEGVIAAKYRGGDSEVEFEPADN